MSLQNFNLPSGKSEFNFEEAASLLGLTSGELEALVAERLAEEGAEKNLARIRFRRADLILLSLMRNTPAAQLDVG
jgi:hypothetical protein